MLIVRLSSELQPAVLPWVLLYLGPDALMPFVSALAAVAGVLLVFWNKVLGFARKLLQIVTRRPDSK